MNATPSFTINGRFLTQQMTGVQRYALNVTRAIDNMLDEHPAAATIVTPRAPLRSNFRNLSIRKKGRGLRGHFWEQLSLPFHSDGRLLNLCNMAPLLHSAEQILCVHDANVFTAPESYSLIFRSTYQILQPLLARDAIRVVTVSHAAARQISHHLSVPLASIMVLPNGHEHALTWEADAALVAPKFLAQRLLNGSRPFVLAIGSQAKHKNISLLLCAADALNDIGIDLVLIGGSSKIFTSEATGVASNVHMLGRVSDEDYAFLLDRALCLAFPSFAEGFGLPVIEAMARGCPVIASNCASMPEVSRGAALLASPFSPAAWISGVRQIVESPQLRTDLSERGREEVKTFTWSDAASGYLHILEQPFAKHRQYQKIETGNPSVAVVYATGGRSQIVSKTVRHLLETQSLKPTMVVVSCAELADAGDLIEEPSVTIVTSRPGLAAQRNTALSYLPDEIEIVVFFDDDFVAHRHWLRNAARIFADEASVIGFTGGLIADGIKGPGISFSEAVRLINERPSVDPVWVERYSPYGCNMAFRVTAIGGIRFDERLVLYGWLEDRDFAAALARNGGRLVKSSDAIGVHMGIKQGRMGGERLGYSQVINPLYMLKKGTMSPSNAVSQIFRNVTSNFARAVFPEPFIDRRGRARGNLRAAADIVRGRLEPERAAMQALRPN